MADLFKYLPTPIDLLKCDCEGGEKWLLSKLSLLRLSHIIVMEYHFDHVDESWVLEQLRLAGFNILNNSTGPYSGHVIAMQM